MKRQSNHVRFVCFYVVCVRVRMRVCVCVGVRGIVSTVIFLLMPNKRVVSGTLLIDLDLKTRSLRRPWGWAPIHSVGIPVVALPKPMGLQQLHI